jgi:hypothetical protein
MHGYTVHSSTVREGSYHCLGLLNIVPCAGPAWPDHEGLSGWSVQVGAAQVPPPLYSPGSIPGAYVGNFVDCPAGKAPGPNTPESQGLQKPPAFLSPLVIQLPPLAGASAHGRLQLPGEQKMSVVC